MHPFLKKVAPAFQTAIFLINRMPIPILCNMSSPFQTLFHHSPDYKFLCVFGAVCWPNLRPFNQHKMYFRSQICVFMGYTPNHKGYNCLHLPTGCTYISRDVFFDETMLPFSQPTSNHFSQPACPSQSSPVHLSSLSLQLSLSSPLNAIPTSLPRSPSWPILACNSSLIPSRNTSSPSSSYSGPLHTHNGTLSLQPTHSSPSLNPDSRNPSNPWRI